MEIKRLSPGFSVTAQIGRGDIDEIAAKGFRTKVCNRPDREAPDQPSSLQLAAEAACHGLTFEYIPVVPDHVSDRDARMPARFLGESPGPALAFCRTGARSERLWQRAGELARQTG